jgi:uncharacterized protein
MEAPADAIGPPDGGGGGPKAAPAAGLSGGARRGEAGAETSRFPGLAARWRPRKGRADAGPRSHRRVCGSAPLPTSDTSTVTDPDLLRRLYGEIPKRAAGKVHQRLDRHDRAFIAASPFLVLATSAANGLLDVSPRGDNRGFVHVLDDATVVLPDRPGNNRIDSLLNLLTDPRASMIFLVPGIGHTLRLNGTAVVSTDPQLRKLGAVRGRLPVTAMVLTVHEALYQCPRALVRSRLWDPARQLEPGSLASLDEVLADQVPDLTLEESMRLGSADRPLW